MMNTPSKRFEPASRLLLLLSGLVACAIAAMIFFVPDAFYAPYGIDLAGNASLLNELKAPTGVLLAAGLLMVAGVFRQQLTGAALAAAAAIYLAYGLSRVLSFAVDGMPHNSLVGAAVFEIAVGATCLLALLLRLKRNHDHFTQ